MHHKNSRKKLKPYTYVLDKTLVAHMGWAVSPDVGYTLEDGKGSSQIEVVDQLERSGTDMTKQSPRQNTKQYIYIAYV